MGGVLKKVLNLNSVFPMFTPMTSIDVDKANIKNLNVIKQ